MHDTKPSDAVLSELDGESLRNRAQRLGSWLDTLADDEEDSRILYALVYEIDAAFFLGMGIWAGLDESYFGGKAENVLYYSYYLSFGSVMAGMGIYRIATSSVAESRWQQWQKDSKDGIDSVELMRYEGELRSIARESKSSRLTEGLVGAFMAVGGIGIITLSAVADLEQRAEILGYVIGGVFTGLGVLNSILSYLDESEGEKAWRKYQQGLSFGEEEEELKLSFFPVILATGGGFVISGWI